MPERPRLRAIVLTVSLLAGTPASATTLLSDGVNELGSHGYLRAGAGLSGSDDQVCFKAPGAGAKYRLGNECEVYGKVSAYFRHQERADGPYLHLEYMPEFNGNYGEAVEFTRNIQSFAEFGNLFGSPVDVWIGRRYNFRRDIHINDYFYMNLWGDGLGVRDIPLGPVKLAYTYMRDAEVPAVAGLDAAVEVRQHSHDLSLYGWAPNPGGSVMLDLRLAGIDGKTLAVGGVPVAVEGADGWALSLQHRQEAVLGGVNTFVIQYGRGAARSAWSSAMENATALGRLAEAGAAGLEAAETWRLVDFHLLDAERWAMMSAVVVEHKDHRGFDGTDQIWLSLGLRPMYFLDPHWRLVVELGLDRVMGEPRTGSLLKQTLAVEWAPRRAFMARPAWRAYVTHAGWSDSLRGLVGRPEYGDATDGWGAGVQVEAWW